MNNTKKNYTTSDCVEIWKDIPSFCGAYQASNMGRIRSLDRDVYINNGKKAHIRKIKGRVLSPYMQNYMRVNLSLNGETHSFLVHRLVAETFLGKPKEGYEVDHINENKEDNRVDNLRWITSFENKSRSTKGRYRRSSQHLSNNPKAKMVFGSINDTVVERYACAKELSIVKGVNYSTLKSQLQEKRCIINGIIYHYGDFTNKKI